MNKINVAFRIIAGYVDLLITAGITMLIFEIFVGEINANDWRLYAVSFPLMIVKDAFGQSIGKYLLGVEIIDSRTGQKAQWYQRILKNSTVALMVFVEAPMVLIRKDHRKLGDLIAKTDIAVNERSYALHLFNYLIKYISRK